MSWQSEPTLKRNADPVSNATRTEPKNTLEEKETNADIPKPILESHGYCVTCDSDATFVSLHPWLRDNFKCQNCGSIPRERAIMLTIERFFPNWRVLAIHESSPGGRGASLKLSKQCKDYIGTHFFPGFPPGEIHKGWRCENLEDQTFPDESFDLIVTQDVMEHIPNPEKAFAEIARTLKPGGAHIFTVPIVRKDQPSQIRAELDENGEVRHLLPEQYHGNPVDQKGSLVTRDWGYDICTFIQNHSGLLTTMVHFDDLEHGIRAELIEVLVSRKLSSC